MTMTTHAVAPTKMGAEWVTRMTLLMQNKV
jgi:hypothetical protein